MSAKPRNICGKGRDPKGSKLIRITFWTPYPTRSGHIHSRGFKPLVKGQLVTIDDNKDTYVITGSTEMDTPVFGYVTQYDFTASDETVKRWTELLRKNA